VFIFHLAIIVGWLVFVYKSERGESFLMISIGLAFFLSSVLSLFFQEYFAEFFLSLGLEFIVVVLFVRLFGKK